MVPTAFCAHRLCRVPTAYRELEPNKSRITITMHRRVAIRRFGSACALEEQPGVELIRHADAAVNLDHFVRHVGQELARLTFSKGAERRRVLVSGIDGLKRAFEALVHS